MPTIPRAPSPWTGSEHRATHRWQLDTATDLADVSSTLHALAGELAAAHEAGWSLRTPMRRGDLHATRPSRRQRTGIPDLEAQPTKPLPKPTVRLRIVDEPEVAGLETFVPEATRATPIVSGVGANVGQVGGPPLADDMLEVLRDQLPMAEVVRRWAVVASLTSPATDVVAAGSALRQHAVHDQALVRTHEAIAFHHVADGARTLLEAAKIYRALATSVAEMADVGCRLDESDDGLITINLPERTT